MHRQEGHLHPMSFLSPSFNLVVQCGFRILKTELENIVYSRRLVFYIPIKTKFAIKIFLSFFITIKNFFALQMKSMVVGTCTEIEMTSLLVYSRVKVKVLKPILNNVSQN